MTVLKIFEPFSICGGQSNTYAEQSIKSSLLAWEPVTQNEIDIYVMLREIY
jgi:hypothetical protein